MNIEPSHEMVSAGHKVTDYAEVDVREVFKTMLSADEQHVRCCLIREGWCPPNGPNNPSTQSFSEAEGEFNAEQAKSGGMPYGTYGGAD
jgi:hypothetical protein